MIISILLMVLANLFLVGGILWSVFVRKLGKTTVRFYTVIGALAVAIVVTIILRTFVFTEDLLPWIAVKFNFAIKELLELSPALLQVVMGAVGGLLTPLIFFVVFLVANLIAWIVYLVIAMVRGQKMKKKDAKVRYSKTKALIFAIVQTLIILVVWMIPIAAYTELAPTVMTEISKSGMLDESGTEIVDTVLEDYVEPVNDNVMLGAFRVLGGDALCDTMTSFKVNDETVHLEDEVDSIASLTTNILCLSKCDMKKYGPNEEASIIAIADAIGDSKLLSLIAGEVAHAATDAWKEGDDFVGVSKDAVYIDKSGMFNDFTDSLIIVINKDSAPGNEEALCKDLSTIADMVAIMIRSDVFAGLGDQEALVEALSKDGVISALITELGENNSMKVLIPEMTNIGVRAIGKTLEMNESKQETYDHMMSSIASGLNSAKKKDGEAQINAVTETLTKAFDEAGLAIDQDIIPCYSAVMIESIMIPSGDQPVTAQDVRVFFAVYSYSLEHTPVVLVGGNSTRPLSTPVDLRIELLRGTRYEGMNKEELAQTGPALLARLTQKLTALSATDDLAEQLTLQAQARQILQSDYYTTLNTSAKKAFDHALDENNMIVVSADTHTVSASLYSVTGMAGYTSVITLNELLVDVDAAAKKLNGSAIDKEAAAIEEIFHAAQTLAKESADSDGALEMETIADSIGAILNELNGTVSFGREKTDMLFIAVMQSRTVRESASIDMQTATQLGISGSEGENPDYKQTFKAMFKTVDVMASMSKNNGELSDGEIEELIREINPQSASMIETFVTPERMEEEYDVPNRYAGTAAPLLSNMFGYMGDAEMSDEQYQAESTAINNVMTVTMTARDNVRDPDHNQSLFGEEGVLGKDAKSTVDELMASESLAHSLNTTEFEEDPFELSDVMANNQETDEGKELEDAIRQHYEENPTEETKQTLGNLAKLFGVSDIDTILGTQPTE